MSNATEEVKDKAVAEAKRFAKRARLALMGYPVVFVVAVLIGYMLGKVL